MSGGGVALIRAEAALDKIDLTGDEATGARIVRDSLRAARLIADNAGAEGAVIVERIRTEGDRAATTPRGGVGRHVQDRHPRPREGHALGVAERGFDRGDRHHRRERRGGSPRKSLPPPANRDTCTDRSAKVGTAREGRGRPSRFSSEGRSFGPGLREPREQADGDARAGSGEQPPQER